MTEQLIGQLGYIGIALILILGGLGLPIPEEAPIIVAAVLSRNGQMVVVLAFASCLAGVILGDFVVYGLGYFYGEKVLSFRIAQRILTRQREAQIKGYFQRHGFKILVSGRFVPGFRTAAYLTAGILKLPPLKLLLTDLVAATLSTSVMFGLGYAFAYHIQSGIAEAQKWLLVLLAAGVCGGLFWRYYRARQRAGLPVGPPVLDSDDVPLPSETAFDDSARSPRPAATSAGSELPFATLEPGVGMASVIKPGTDEPVPAPADLSRMCEPTSSTMVDPHSVNRPGQVSPPFAADPSGASVPAAFKSKPVHPRDRSADAVSTADSVMLEIDPSGSPASID